MTATPRKSPVRMARRFPTCQHLAGHPKNLPHPTWSAEDLRQRNAAALANGNFTSWAGPWGVSFAANLTPDKETGIGEWEEDTFARALRTGKHQGQPNGRPILPPMPWPVYKNATDDDWKAISAYLKSIPPIKNQVPFPVAPKVKNSRGGPAGRPAAPYPVGRSILFI